MQSKIVYLCGSPYKTSMQISKELDLCTKTVQNRVLEIEKEVVSGRYGDQAVIRDGHKIVLINFLVFVDYMTYRQRLKSKNLRKRVPKFDAKKVAKEIGWYEEVVG